MLVGFTFATGIRPFWFPSKTISAILFQSDYNYVVLSFLKECISPSFIFIADPKKELVTK